MKIFSGAMIETCLIDRMNSTARLFPPARRVTLCYPDLRTLSSITGHLNDEILRFAQDDTGTDPANVRMDDKRAGAFHYSPRAKRSWRWTIPTTSF